MRTVRTRRNRKGVVTVEFALILPIALTLFVCAAGIIQALHYRAVCYDSAASAGQVLLVESARGNDWCDNDAQSAGQRIADIIGATCQVGATDIVVSAESTIFGRTIPVTVTRPAVRLEPVQ